MPSAKSLKAKTLVRDSRRVMDECAGLAAQKLARRVARFIDDRLAPAGLSFAQFGLMTCVAAATDDTIGKLAKDTDLDPSTLSRNLRTLERAGLVEITVVESDLRRRAVWLTEKGARRLETAIKAWKRAHAELARRLDVESLRQCADDARPAAQSPTD